MAVSQSATHQARVVVRADGAVRVHVSPDVLFNLDRSTAALKSVLGRLGHPGCTSGFNIQLVLEEQEFQTGT